MDLSHIALRCLVAYAFLLAMNRIKGKRTVAEATPFDFVLALILGDMIDDIIWAEVPVARFMIATGTLVVVDLLVTIGIFYNDTLYRWIEGTPRVVMADGVMDGRSLRAEQMNEADVEAMLRLEGLDRHRYEEIRRGFLEVNGDTSVLQHLWAQPAQRQDANEVKKRHG